MPILVLLLPCACVYVPSGVGPAGDREKLRDMLLLTVRAANKVGAPDVATAVVTSYEMIKDEKDKDKLTESKVAKSVREEMSRGAPVGGQGRPVAAGAASASSWPGASYMGGAGGMSLGGMQGRPRPPCYLCHSREHVVLDCPLNLFKWPYQRIKDILRTCTAEQAVAMIKQQWDKQQQSQGLLGWTGGK